MRKATNGFKKLTTAPVKTAPEPRAFNAEECALYLGLSNWHIEEELRAGKIPFRWVAGMRVIDRKDADAYFESLPYAPGSAPLRSLPNDQLEKLFAEAKLAGKDANEALRRGDVKEFNRLWKQYNG
jgi:hypothetical protein